MANVFESMAGASPLRSAMEAGVETISSNQEIIFTKYVRKILPLDGYVFWLEGEKISVSGSLHYSMTREATEEETYTITSVVFTTINPITILNEIRPQIIWIASFKGINFVFGQQGMFYNQAGLYHYTGKAVYSSLTTQLVKYPYGLLDLEPIVSNSLPIWLSLQSYSTPWMTTPNPGIELFPSYLTPNNLVPPFGTVHIEPMGTQAIQVVPYLNGNNSHYQLSKDKVKITFYGLNNSQSLNFMDLVNQYCIDTEAMGLMNTPLIRDEKRPQMELMAIAMKKSVEFEINYYQSTVRDLAKKLISSASIEYNVI